jgi:hypothetical protein
MECHNKSHKIADGSQIIKIYQSNFNQYEVKQTNNE